MNKVAKAYCPFCKMSCNHIAVDTPAGPYLQCTMCQLKWKYERKNESN